MGQSLDPFTPVTTSARAHGRAADGEFLTDRAMILGMGSFGSPQISLTRLQDTLRDSH